MLTFPKLSQDAVRGRGGPAFHIQLIGKDLLRSAMAGLGCCFMDICKAVPYQVATGSCGAA